MINKKYLYIFSFLFFVIACSNNNLDENLKRTDKIFGKCDNPHRSLTSREYKICKAQEMGGDPDKEPLSLSSLITGGASSKNVTYISSVNSNLWNASLKVLENYPIKNADSNGGYIETEAIYDQQNKNERCTIKVSILSSELLSTSVTTKIICENRVEDIWIIENENFENEEKKLVLKILSIAQELQSSNSNS
jgi:hypothetical protein